jgi:hypothetical protein
MVSGLFEKKRDAIPSHPARPQALLICDVYTIVTRCVSLHRINVLNNWNIFTEQAKNVVSTESITSSETFNSALSTIHLR